MMKKRSLIIALILALLLTGCRGAQQPEPASSAAAEKPVIYLYPDSQEEPEEPEPEEPLDEKPVIYLYPDSREPEPAEKPAMEDGEITVSLEYAGTLTATYPASDGTWHVRATPDGIITDENGREYNCLFWEGVSDTSYDFRRGFVVPGNETRQFLEEKLAILGLSDREAGDFITYWLPRMQGSPYNLVAFQGRAYTDSAKLTVTPEPDTMIRVFMAFRPLEEPLEIPEQELPRKTRQGFTVVEWGGAEVDAD